MKHSFYLSYCSLLIIDSALVVYLLDSKLDIVITIHIRQCIGFPEAVQVTLI